MKKILLIALTMVLIGVANFAHAQSTTPRFGITANNDNTGRVLTYKYLAVTDATGADSIAVTPAAWQSHYQVTLTDSFTFKQPNITRCYATDNLRIIASGASGTKIKFTGSYWQSAGTATLSSGGRAVIDFVFDGSKWVESNRTVQ
jgi:hypothetical protein